MAIFLNLFSSCIGAAAIYRSHVLLDAAMTVRASTCQAPLAPRPTSSSEE